LVHRYDFLAEQAILEECEEPAVKQILADQIKTAMETERLTKAAMAIRMRTSRRALDRLLDPTNTSVTLHTLQRAAVAIGRQLRLELYLKRRTPVRLDRLGRPLVSAYLGGHASTVNPRRSRYWKILVCVELGFALRRR